MCNEEAKEAPGKLAYGMTDEDAKGSRMPK
jgi:hypothetical protein